MHNFVRWDQIADSEETNALLRELSEWHISQLKENERQCLHSAFSGGVATLCDLRVPYARLEPHGAWHYRQVKAFFEKRIDLGDDASQRQVALEGFVGSEKRCAETNEIFRLWSAGRFQFDRRVEAVLYRAQQKISRLLDMPPPHLEDLHLRFGPGATTQVAKKNASAVEKLRQSCACSEALASTVETVICEFPHLCDFVEDVGIVTVEIHNGRLSFVPKSLKTHRTICVEPWLNSVCQLGIGRFLAGVLRRVGVNIKDQSLNQRLAKRGSLSGDLATLDLSSASDSIATELVAHLLPLDWYSYLYRFRTGKVEMPKQDGGEILTLQKFSSMGNGFTFPLETLIFWSLASASEELAAGPNRVPVVSVYGDDIIVPTYAVELLTQVLTSCGFVLNMDKSFWDGPFRESCGKDYLSGIDVRPFYQKDCLQGSDTFALHNYYVRRGEYEPAAMVLNWIDPSLRIFGPDGYGDGHLLGPHSVTPHRRGSGWSGYTFETYTFKSRRKFVSEHRGVRVYPSYSVYLREESLDPQWEEQHGLDRSGMKMNFRFLVDQVSYNKKGQIRCTTPGTRGYRRISIYTLQHTSGHLDYFPFV